MEVFDRVFLNTLLWVFPVAHRPAVQAIIDGPGSVYQKGDAIYNLLIDLVLRGAPGLRFNNVAAVTEWYNMRVAQYNHHLNGDAQVA